jgi:hypothetical protein
LGGGIQGDGVKKRGAFILHVFDRRMRVFARFFALNERQVNIFARLEPCGIGRIYRDDSRPNCLSEFGRLSSDAHHNVRTQKIIKNQSIINTNAV